MLPIIAIHKLTGKVETTPEIVTRGFSPGENGFAEGARQTVMQTLAIPRAQVALAIGFAEPDAREFELVAGERGICSGPFLEQAFRTVEFRIRVAVGPGDTWSYEQDTVLQVRGRAELFHHRDRNTLMRIAAPTPNPLAR